MRIDKVLVQLERFPDLVHRLVVLASQVKE